MTPMSDAAIIWQLPHLLRRGLSIPQIAGNRIASVLWPSYSRLVMVGDGANWSITWDVREVSSIARKLGIRVSCTGHALGIQRQSVFYASQFAALLNSRWLDAGNRIGLAYFHGDPSSLEPNLVECFGALIRNQDRIHRIQVSHAAMHGRLLESGIPAEKVFLIPIGINPGFFPFQTTASRLQARRTYGLPESAVIIGSFQKDGVGWGRGDEPKKIKGPDVFLQTIELLKSRIPELFVLLSGPARGFVKDGLSRLGVPYRHVYLKNYALIGQLYQALDLYLVTSREEGGPKAVLESMATGVPLVTTRVGQAADLVQHGRNGWLVDVEDAEGLAQWAEHAIASRNSPAVLEVLKEGRKTAEANTYDSQAELWKEFFKGFVETT